MEKSEERTQEQLWEELMEARRQIEELKKDKMELKRFGETQRIIFDSVPAMIWYKDSENKILHANEPAAHSMGLSIEEVEGRSTYDLYPEEAAKYHADDLEVIRSGKPKLGIIEPYQDATGQKRWVRTDKIPYRDDAGKIIGVIVFAIDITEGKRAEEALKKTQDELETGIRERTAELAQANQVLEREIAERKLAEEEIRKTQAFLDSIVENLPDMIFVKEAKELRFVRFNRAGEYLLGYSRDQMIGKNDYDFFPEKEADFFTGKDREVLDKGVIEDILEEPIHTRDKGIRILHTKKVPLYDKQGKPQYLLGISEDITEKKQDQEVLIQKTELLAHSKAELEQLELFAFSATHDLQEPLLKIIFYSDLLEKETSPKLDPRGRTHLKRIRSGAFRMRHIMEQLRELSRIGTAALPFERINLRDIVHEVLLDLDLRIAEAGAKVEIGELPALSADRTQMRQLFQNLIGNALKFRRQEEILHVTVRSRKVDKDRIEITVEDNGIGFDEKYLDRIFKPFQRLHGGNEYEGSGLGLAICQKIVLRHGGEISARSSPGQGAAFIMTLPGLS